MAAKNVYEARIIGQVANQVFNLVLHLQDNDIRDPDPKKVANAVMLNFAGAARAVTSNEATFQYCLARVIGDPMGEPYMSDSGNNLAGQVTAPALPSFNAAIVQQRTGFISRRKRGRIYMPGVPQTYVSGGQINATGTTGYNQFFTTLGTAFNNTTWPYVVGVFSRKTWKVDLQGVEASFTPVTQWAINPVIGQQRRRKIGIGS